MQLIEAAAVGWMDEIVKLLDQGADVNATEGVRLVRVFILIT